MGCVETKPEPENPFFTGSDNTKVIHVANGVPPVTVEGADPPTQSTRQPPQSNQTNHGEKPTGSTKLTFDPRVAAKYDIKALIGKGSFSQVVRVQHKANKHPYAIKMIDRDQGSSMFETELSVLRRVKHPYVIQLVEVFESRFKVYMVMELATGGELLDTIFSKGTFCEEDAAKVLRMVLEGLKYLHSLGITHRDLKPENLLYYSIARDSKIMITDFGLSNTSSTGSCTEMMSTACGTPEYIAPEVLMRKPYTSKVDCWAVGVISYILLSGMMPFDDENRSRLYKKILRAELNFAAEHWRDVTSRAKNFITGLLKVDPLVRWSAGQALTHPWLSPSGSSSSSASARNLRRTISNNLIHRQQSTAANSVRSNKSSHSNRSNKSTRSLRSEHRRIQPEELEALHKDPDVVHLCSLSSTSSPSGSGLIS